VTFVLRAAAATDVDDLLALWLEAAENDSRPTDTRDAVLALLARDPDAAILAEADGELIGSVIAGWDGWRYHLYRLAVHPSWRRQGVGRLLLSAAEGRFTALGATRADAMVLASNDLGQQLWDARGYHEQPEWRRWVKALLPGNELLGLGDRRVFDGVADPLIERDRAGQRIPIHEQRGRAEPVGPSGR
jgi:ribosomal protein S18 acetylase RimI-like enzyme